jgi:hypothetical protein
MKVRYYQVPFGEMLTMALLSYRWKSGGWFFMKSDVGPIKSNMSSMLFYVPPALLLPILF